MVVDRHRHDPGFGRAQDIVGGAVARVFDPGSIDWVEQNAGNECYSLTLQLAILGQRLLANRSLTDLKQPILDDLANHRTISTGSSGAINPEFEAEWLKRFSWPRASNDARAGSNHGPSDTSCDHVRCAHRKTRETGTANEDGRHQFGRRPLRGH